MKTNFKLSLVAVALATVGFSANAANVTTTAVKVSKQGVTAVTEATLNTASTITFTPEAAYSVGDNVIFTFSGDSLKSAPLTITSTTVAGQQSITLGRIGQTANSATYRVTEVGATGTNQVNPHGTISFVGNTATGFGFDRAKVAAAGKVEVTAKSTLTGSGATFDTPVADGNKLTRTVFEIVDQTKVAASPVVNATIDVTATSNARKVFVAGAAQTVTFTAAVESTVGNVNVASHSVKVDGDFSWAINPTTGYVAGSVVPACSAGTPTGLVVTAASASFVCSNVASSAATTASLTLDPTAYDADITKRPELSQTSYTGTFASTYVGDAVQTTSNVSAGSWGINGSVIHVPYMVYGAVGTKTFSQIVNVANNSSAAGKVYADVWTTAADGKVTRILNNKQIGTVAARGLYRAAGDLRTAIEAAGFKDGYVQMRLTTDIGADHITVYSAYVDNSNSERAIVNNDSPVNVRGASQLATAGSVANLATTVGTLATSAQLTAAVAPLATTAQLNTAVAPLATTAQLTQAVTDVNAHTTTTVGNAQTALNTAITNVGTAVSNVATAVNGVNTTVNTINTNLTTLDTKLCAAGTGTVDLTSVSGPNGTGAGANNAALTLDICN